MRESSPEIGGAGALDAVFLYMGILDAYEAVGIELIGPDVLDEHVLPRMVYYLEEFLPEIFSGRSDSGELVQELRLFLEDFRERVNRARERGSAEGLTKEDIWKLRAAIFGYESVFIKIVGESAIKNYVLVRISDILSAYLPSSLMDPGVSLKDKLQGFADFLRAHGFVGYARASVGRSGVKIATNKCEYSRIHDSEAYRNLNVRFCPWGMIASAIVAAHEGKETTLQSSTFTTRGSVTEIDTK
ncbi:MAG: hypothetical protein ACXADS_03050 [Candidatus Thorarchaeota archaeon]|jgi:hypothetical protein